MNYFTIFSYSAIILVFTVIIIFIIMNIIVDYLSKKYLPLLPDADKSAIRSEIFLKPYGIDNVDLFYKAEIFYEIFSDISNIVFIEEEKINCSKILLYSVSELYTVSEDGVFKDDSLLGVASKFNNKNWHIKIHRRVLESNYLYIILLHEFLHCMGFNHPIKKEDKSILQYRVDYCAPYLSEKDIRSIKLFYPKKDNIKNKVVRWLMYKVYC